MKNVKKYKKHDFFQFFLVDWIFFRIFATKNKTNNNLLTFIMEDYVKA